MMVVAIVVHEATDHLHRHDARWATTFRVPLTNNPVVIASGYPHGPSVSRARLHA
jgi:hypothetical protein